MLKKISVIAVVFLFTAGLLQAENKNIELQKSNWSGSPSPVEGFYKPLGKQSFKTVDFSGPGRWELSLKRPESFDAVKQISLRVYSNAKAECNLSFIANEGSFSCSLDLVAGEQIKIIPIKVFSRKGKSPSWRNIKSISLKISSKSTCEIKLISLTGNDSNITVPEDKNLWLVQPLTVINHIATATPLYAIVDEETYPKRFQSASRAFFKNLKQLYNLTIPINPKNLKDKKELTNVIILGKKAALKTGTVTEDELKKEGFNGFIVKSENGSLTIAGESIQGTVYGVYKYFEKNGLKFFARGVFTKKKRAGNYLLAMNFKDKPFFKGKRISVPSCIYGDSAVTFSMGDVRTAGIDAEYPCDKTQWIDHTAAFLVPKKLYMKDHPEYFILRGNGKRLPADTPDVRLMVCQTNPGGLKVAADRALKWIEKQKERKYFVIQQGDDMEACLCESCEKKRAEGWNESDLMLNWVNYIADKVYEKYPDKYLLCYAYVSTQPAPNKLKGAKNVQLLYAPWPNKISAPNGFRDFDAPENVIAGTQLNEWSDKCGSENLGIYDYNSYSALTQRGMADRVKWLARKGMKGGFWYCGVPQIFPNLFRYVHSQLNWDPLQNVRTLEKDFIRAYYGKAAPVMEKIITAIFDRLDEDDRNNSRKPAPEFFSKQFSKQILTWFDEAKKLAPEKLKKEIASDRYNFSLNGIYALKPVNRANVTKEQTELFGLFLSVFIKYELNKYKIAVERAKKANKYVPKINTLVDKIWNLTHVKIDIASLKEGEIPSRLLELEKSPVATINKYQIKEFTKNLPDGSVLIPAMAFSGGVGPIYYKWKCEGKVAAWVRGAMTEVSSMKADFKLDKTPSGKFELEIEGQDSDKLWCPTAPIQISLNDKMIFEGPNGFKKHGWSKKSFTIPEGILKKGKNRISIKNLAGSDSRSAHWFMISEMKLKQKKEK